MTNPVISQHSTIPPTVKPIKIKVKTPFDLQHPEIRDEHPLLRLTFAMGARQFVVQEALDTTCISGEYLSWLTPITNIGASCDGAEITTFLAPP